MVWSPPVFFECPLAATALFYAGQLGFVAQCADGAWVPGKPWVAPALQALEAVLWAVPPEQQRQAARTVTRAWFFEVLASFTDAAAAGRETAVWVPRGPLD